MAQTLDYLRETPSQTAGPYLHIGLAPGAAGCGLAARAPGGDIAGPDAAGERIRVEGVVTDGTGAPVRDALLEVWQANARGVYAHPDHPGTVEEGFRGWGRAVADLDTGTWGFDTVKPGPVTGPDGRVMAPHITLWIVARGINLGLATRLYFSDEAEANAADPVLALIEGERRRRTLIAERREGDGGPTYRFDIRLQGADETVFLDI